MRKAKQMEKVKKMFSESRVNLKLLTVFMVLLFAVVGCAKPHTLPDNMYEVKQVQQFQKPQSCP